MNLGKNQPNDAAPIVPVADYILLIFIVLPRTRRASIGFYHLISILKFAVPDNERKGAPNRTRENPRPPREGLFRI